MNSFGEFKAHLFRFILKKYVDFQIKCLAEIQYFTPSFIPAIIIIRYHDVDY